MLRNQRAFHEVIKKDKVVHARVNALGFNFEMVLYISNVFKQWSLSS